MLSNDKEKLGGAAAVETPNPKLNEGAVDAGAPKFNELAGVPNERPVAGALDTTVEAGTAAPKLNPDAPPKLNPPVAAVVVVAGLKPRAVVDGAAPNKLVDAGKPPKLNWDWVAAGVETVAGVPKAIEPVPNAGAAVVLK